MYYVKLPINLNLTACSTLNNSLCVCVPKKGYRHYARTQQETKDGARNNDDDFFFFQYIYI